MCSSALTDPRRRSGSGSAYCDEILHCARLSPLAWMRSLDADATQQLFGATRPVLADRMLSHLLQDSCWPRGLDELG
jgi:formamidopyrimidine-DNA glycosylase